MEILGGYIHIGNLLSITLGPTIANRPRHLEVEIRKRILLENPWSSGHGGTSTVALEFVKHLDHERFEPTALYPTDGGFPEQLRELKIPYLIHPLPGLNRKSPFRFIKETYWSIRFLQRTNRFGAPERSFLALQHFFSVLLAS